MRLVLGGSRLVRYKLPLENGKLGARPIGKFEQAKEAGQGAGNGGI
jgi:hypothetical protein